MKTKAILSILILTFYSVFFFSCEESMVNTDRVSGNLYYYINLPAGNLTLNVGDVTVRTDNNGSFTAENVAYPYDITIADTMSRNVTIFKKLSMDKVNLFLNGFTNNSNHVTININLPSYIFSHPIEGKLIFSDGKYVNSYSGISSNYNGLNFYLPDNNPVTGKIILLTYTKDSYGRVISYENYGVINNVTISRGIYNYAFDSVDVAFNPGEATVSGSVTAPPEYNAAVSSFIIAFSNYYIPDDFGQYAFGQSSGNIFNFKIPTGISEPFIIYTDKNYFGINGIGFSRERFPVYPSSQNNLEIKTFPDLISPLNEVKEINDDTPFSFTGGSGEGIYEINLYDISKSVNYRLITSSTDFTLRNIDNTGFGPINNHDFRWYVEKNGYFTSMNDYAVNKINKGIWFLTQSTYRSFSTKP